MSLQRGTKDPGAFAKLDEAFGIASAVDGCLTAYVDLLHDLDQFFYIPPVMGYGADRDDWQPWFAEERLAVLRSLPYKDYLLTSEWQGARKAALARADHRCQVCNSPKALQVHHRTYARRGEEEIRDLTVLCDACHGEFHQSGRRLTP